FISSHHDKIGKGVPSNHSDIRGTLGNTQSDKNEQTKEVPADKRPNWNNQGKGFRCWNCGKLGHMRNRCRFNKGDSNNKTSFVASNNSTDVGPPPAIADEYCQIQEEHLSGGNFAIQAEYDVYDQVVDFYEKEMMRRRHNIENKAENESDPLCDETTKDDYPLESTPSAGNVHVAQQILSTAGSNACSDRWLFDTGADVDATNRRQNFRSGTVVELRSDQFPIQTG
ncbi:hypothetical protein K3495_g16874, partial [Podosphaera aphanis]